MRTTLNIDDDLIAVAEALARRDRASLGQVVSRPIRQALAARIGSAAPGDDRCVAGFRPFPARPGVVTSNRRVDALRDELGI